MFGKGLSSNDIQALTQFNNQIKNGISYSQAYKNSLSNCSVAGKQMAVQIAKGKVSVDSLTNASKASAIGMGLLNAAMNFGIMMAVTGLIELGKYLWKLVPTTKHLKDRLKETSQALAGIRSERESLNDKLKTTEERIAELESKGVLSFTDQAELDRLNKENAALKTKIELLDIEARKKRKENQENFNDVIDKEETATSNKSWEKTEWHGNNDVYANVTDKDRLLELAKAYDEATKSGKDYIDVKGKAHSIEDIENEITAFSDNIQEYQSYLDDLYQDGFDYDTADKETKQNIDFANEMIDRYMVLAGTADTLWERIYSSDRFAGAKSAIEELGTVTAESLSQLYNENDDVKEFYDYISKVFGYDTSNIDEQTAAIKKQADAYNALVNGNVDYNKRPLISPEQMKAVYPDFNDEIGTTYDMDFGLSSNITGEILYTVKATPILEDGTVLDQKSLDEYIYEELQPIVDNGGSTEDLLAYDKAHKKILINVDVGDTPRNSEGLTDLDKQLGDIKASHWELTKQLNDNSGFNNLANELNKVADAGKNAVSAIKSFTDIFSPIEDAFDAIKDASKDMKEQGFLSADSIKAMEKSGLTAYLEQVDNGYKLTTDALNDYLSAQGKQYQDAVDTAISKGNELVATLGESANKYKDNASGLATFLRVQATANQSMARVSWINNLIAQNPAITASEASRMWMSSEARKNADSAALTYLRAASEIETAIANQKTFNSVTSTLNRDNQNNLSKGSNSDPYKKYFDDLKHRRELDIINQKQYLIELYNLNENYYKDNKDYIDEYASNMEELYDGFKTLYKEDFEAKKESLEEQKDAVTKYYDDLIDKIKEANEQEDYEEEQAEKRKTIFELKAKIEDLLRDGSQRALARAAELQEELADAEKELLDFEKDNARDNEIQRLEKAQEAEEDKIQKQIDSIDKTLSDIDDGVDSVRQAIIDYARAYGVTITPVQQAATGTFNALGGLTRINEQGIELIATPDGHGNYVNMLPASKVLTAQQTATLMALSQGQLPQAMYNSIARSIGAKVNSPAVNNYNQPITIQMGDIIIQGNADKQTVADIKKEQDNTVRMVLQKIKELQK